MTETPTPTATETPIGSLLPGNGRVGLAAPLDNPKPPTQNLKSPVSDPQSPIARTITYTYGLLSRLTSVTYSTGQTYRYSYDPVGNRLQQIANGYTTTYQYDAANRLVAVSRQPSALVTMAWATVWHKR